jgi:5-formyltetrahydrofolate cyclo-ligase
MYKIVSPNKFEPDFKLIIKQQADGIELTIPFDTANRHYEEYLLWLEGKEFIDGAWVVTNPNGNRPEIAEE